MNEGQDTALLEEVNPVFTTAQACVLILAEAGDPDAAELVRRLGFDRKIRTVDRDALTEMEKFQIMKAIPGFTTMVEARYRASDCFISRSGCGTVIDLPCGYTPRGIALSGSGKRYYGFDLPAVIQALVPAIGSRLKGDPDITYHEVDATSYASMRRAIGEVRGPLLVTMEGLLMYFTQSELEEVFRSMHRLLTEFGGQWITTDNMIVAAQSRLKKVIAPDQEENAVPPGAPKAENAFFDPEQAEAFVKRMGFRLEKLPVYDFLPETLHTLSLPDPDLMKQARDVFREMYFWRMRPEPSFVSACVDEENRFSADVRREGDTLQIRLKGRLDTITGPEFLTLYRKAAEENPIQSVVIDMEELEYISSAGLRILLIMRKETGRVSLLHIGETVRAVLESSGFLETLFPEATEIS